MRSNPPRRIYAIEDAILELRQPLEAREFLEAILSAGEHERLQKRWHAYQLRAAGVSVKAIVETAHVATATASRVAALHRSAHRSALNAVIARLNC